VIKPLTILFSPSYVRIQVLVVVNMKTRVPPDTVSFYHTSRRHFVEYSNYVLLTLTIDVDQVDKNPKLCTYI
jgi:hypothetical protein